MDEKPETKPMGQVIQIDEARIRDHLGEMVRGTVRGGAECDAGCGSRQAVRRRTQIRTQLTARKDTRAGSYERSLDTKRRAGEA